MGGERDPVPDGALEREERPAKARRPARRALPWVAFLACVVLVGWLQGPSLLAALGRWLVQPDPLPDAADVLLVVSGDPYGLREAEAARLWRDGLAPVIIVSGGPLAWQTVAGEVMRRHLLDLGVPPEAIQVEPRASSTAENARYTLPMVRALGARTVVVVTSNYHVRRARWTFREVYAPEQVHILVHGVPDPGFDPDRWWLQGSGREYGLLELAKLVWYALPLDEP